MKKLYKFLLNALPRPVLIRLSYIFKFFAPFLYRGSAVECPVCERSFSKFLSYGSEVAHRENVLCPYDLTLERHRLMWLYLQRETNFFTAANLKVLHIAPEQCFLPHFKKQKGYTYKKAELKIKDEAWRENFYKNNIVRSRLIEKLKKIEFTYT